MQDILDLHPDDIAPPATQMMSFGDEMRATPSLQRWTIYISLGCTVMLFVQCLVIMPLILVKYGWGYSVN